MPEHPLAVRLGRRRSEPDRRNWRLSRDSAGGLVLTRPAAGDPLDALLAAFLKKRYSKEAKALASALVARVEAFSPVPPGPTPVPPGPTPPPAPSGRIAWTLGTPGVLDQGNTPHCVGFTGADFKNLDPVEGHVPNSMGDSDYYACKVIDGEPGQENGSSIHSLAKVLKNEGRISAYAFMSDVSTIKTFVRTKSPVLIGIDWTNSMFTPDSQGFIAPTDAVAGGHALTIVGDYPDLDAALILNHWGVGWGIVENADGTGQLHGYCLMKWSDVGTLIAPSRGGEALGSIELPL